MTITPTQRHRSRRNRHVVLLAVAGSAIASFIALAVREVWFGARGPSPREASAWEIVISDVGSWRVLPVLTVVLSVGLWLSGRRNAGLFVITAVGGAGVIAYTAKFVLSILGAPNDGGRLARYPSGHVSTTAALAGALWILVLFESRSARVRGLATGMAVAVVALMGSVRVLDGSHFVADVIGGALLAVWWLAVCLLIARVSAVGARIR